MEITVNGKPVVIDDRCTVQQLLEQHGMANAPCAVEVNRQIIPKRKHELHKLGNGDQVEIVTLVGGG